MKQRFLKRFAALVLSAGMVITALPASAAAAEPREGQTREATDAIGVYTFDGSLGGNVQAVNKQNGNSAPGAYSGAITYGAGRSGETGDQALSFTDKTAYGVKLPHTNMDTYSISLWMKPTGNIDNNTVILYMGNPTSSPEKWTAISGAGNMDCKFWTKEDGVRGHTTVHTQGFSANIWSNVVITQTGENVSIYKDGALVKQGIASAGLSGGENQLLLIGSNPWDNAFNGLIDDVKVYDKILTTDEVQKRYLEELGQAELENKIRKKMLGSNFGLGRVRSDLTLPETVEGMASISISWKSDKPAVISQDGKIQPGTKNGDTANLTATLKLNGQETELLPEMTFPVRITKAVAPAESGTVIDFNDDTLGGGYPIVRGLGDYTGEVLYGAGRSGAADDKSLSLNGGYGLELPYYNMDSDEAGWTVSMWYNPTKEVAISKYSPLLFVGYHDPEAWVDAAGTGDGNNLLIWGKRPSNNIGFDSSSDKKIFAPVKGSWNMLTLTQGDIDGQDGKKAIRAYVNGQLLWEFTNSTMSVLKGGNQTIYIGANFWDTPFSALIDDVTIIHRELTADEINEEYEKSVTNEAFQDSLKNAVFGASIDPQKVTTNLTLPGTLDGFSIKWQSSDTSVIADNGELKHTTGVVPKAAELSYTAQRSENGKIISGSFAIKAGTETMFTAEEFLQKDANARQDYVKDSINKVMLNGNKSLQQISGDLVLPEEILYNDVKVADIVWGSSNTDYITNQGKVSENLTSVSEKVKLTATITYIDHPATGDEPKSAVEYTAYVAMPESIIAVDAGNSTTEGTDKGHSKESATIEVGVTSTAKDGSEFGAPQIQDVSYTGGSPVGENRIGYVIMDLSDIINKLAQQDELLELDYATLRLRVNNVSGNLGNGNSMKVGAYQINPTVLANSADTADFCTDHTKFPAVDGKYGADAVLWSNEWVSTATKVDEDVTFDVKSLVKQAIAAGQTKIGFRLQVPIAQIVFGGLNPEEAHQGCKPALFVQYSKQKSNEEKAQEDADALVGLIPSSLDEDTAAAVKLPAAGANESNITWTSGDSCISIEKDAEQNIYNVSVTRPNENKTVTITATVTNGDVKREKLFTVEVEAKLTDFDSRLIAYLSMDNRETGLSGKGASAVLTGPNASFEADSVRGKSLHLKGNTFLTAAKTDNTALLQGRDEITISYYSKAEDANVTGMAWTLFAARNAQQAGENNRNYLGIMDAQVAVKAERRTNEIDETVSAERDAEGMTPNVWRKVDLVVRPQETILYIDGKKIDAKESTVKLSEILGASGGVFYIGKSTWTANGEYYNGYLDEYKVYDKALTAEEVGRVYKEEQDQMAQEKADLAAVAADKEALNRPVIDGLTDTITFVTKGANGSTIRWEVIDGTGIVISQDGKTATVTRGEEQTEVHLRATITYGTASDTKQFTVIVPSTDDSQELIDARRKLGDALSVAKEKIAGTKAEDYPEGIWQAFSDAITEAERVSVKGTLEQITAAQKALDEASNNFKSNDMIAAENAVKADKAAVSAPTIDTSNDSVTFVTKGEHGSTISWKLVSGTGVTMAADGKTAMITRGEEASVAVFEVTITYGTVSDTKEIRLTVPKEGDNAELITARRELGDAWRAAKEKLEKAAEADYPADVWKEFADAIAQAEELRVTGTVAQIAEVRQRLKNAEENFKSTAQPQAEATVAADKEALGVPVFDNLNDTLTFITEGEHGSKYSWELKSGTGVTMSEDRLSATVTRGEAASRVIFTVTITCAYGTDGVVSDTKDITFTVPAIGDDEPIITARRELGNAVREAREKMAAATEADYPANVWKAFADAIAEADAIRATGTLEEIQAAKQKLEQAQKNFKTNAEIAKELEEKKKAEAVTNLNTAIDKKPEKAQADYTEASWTAYQKALTDAKNILANTNATADQITAAQKALETAFHGLQLKTQGSGNGNNNGTGNDDQQTSGPVKVSGIKFAASKYQIAAGKKINLGKEVTVSPKNAANKGLTWKTSNKKYATVSKTGVVTTKKAGAGKKVTITAAAADGSKVSKKVTIQIMKNAVTKITLKASSKSVKAGKKVTVKATVRTNGKKVNKKLAWKSSNTKYATVNSKGVVTAKKAGKGKSVKITATATDGTNKKATITIKIKK